MSRLSIRYLPVLTPDSPMSWPAPSASRFLSPPLLRLIGASRTSEPHRPDACERRVRVPRRRMLEQSSYRLSVPSYSFYSLLSFCVEPFLRFKYLVQPLHLLPTAPPSSHPPALRRLWRAFTVALCNVAATACLAQNECRRSLWAPRR